MGKASRWFQSLLGIKKHDSSTPSQPQPHAKPTKRRWSLVKSIRQNQNDHNHRESSDTLAKTALGNHEVAPAPTPPDDPWKQAVAVAPAGCRSGSGRLSQWQRQTVAVAVANDTAAVVRLNNSGRSMAVPSGDVNSASCFGGSGILVAHEEWAAVKIQSHFRANLARRAFRALKALVKLQALVRGHIVRKQTLEALQSLEVLVRAQERALAARSQASDIPPSLTKASQFYYPDPTIPEIYEHSIQRNEAKYDMLLMLRSYGSKTSGRDVGPRETEQMSWKWLDGADEGSHEQNGSSRRVGYTDDDERSDKILEIDSEKIHCSSRRRSMFQASNMSLNSDHYSHSFSPSKDSTGHQTFPSSFSCEVQSSGPLNFSQKGEGSFFCSAENSRQIYSASSNGDSCRKGSFTLARSGSLSGYPDHRNYMAYTESAKAKIRSLSATKQRRQFERSVSTNRHSTHGWTK